MKRFKGFYSFLSIVCLFVMTLGTLSTVQPAYGTTDASAIRYLSGFSANTLSPNDDSSTGLVPIGFNVNFFGNQHSDLYVNNNGNITFNATQSTYTPYDLTSTTRQIIAAYFSDVDTRCSNTVSYGTDTVDGHPAFGVNYFNVGYYYCGSDKLNTFQLILIDRSDVQPGDFDIEFNYEKIQWETGNASGGVSGLGGSSARIGFSNGTRLPNTFFELPGSNTPGSFLDSNPVTSLIKNSYFNPVLGRYHFEARNGEISMHRNPLILVPGIAGSIFENDPENDRSYQEIWPKASSLIGSLNDSYLNALKLKTDGSGPATDDNYQKTVKVKGIITEDTSVPFYTIDAYKSTIDYFTQPGRYTLGTDFFVCPYDWRKAANDIATNSALDQTLQKCIDQATNNDSTKKVDIIAHSMGGMIARWYISNAQRAQRVDHLVTLGTPYLGAPKITLGILGQMCFTDVFNSGWCEPNKDTMHEILQNFPSSYILNPGPEFSQVYPGYISSNWDYGNSRYNDQGQFNWLTSTNADDVVKSHNTTLFPYARQFYYGAAGSWMNSGGTNGVKVLMIVGSGKDTITGVKEEYWGGWGGWNWGVKYTEIKENSGGDGTVPLNSARLYNSATGVDLRNGVSTVYYKYEHGQLQQKSDVLQVAASFMQNSITTSSLALNALSGMDATAGGPSLTPYALEGQRLTFDGNVIVEIIDAQGNRFGQNPDYGIYEMKIPDGSFSETDGHLSIFLPSDRIYTIKINGVAQTEGFVKIEDIANSQLSHTNIYNPMEMTGDSKATLNFNPADVPAAIALDQNGDGTPEVSVNPVASISGEIADTLAPTVSATVSNSANSCGVDEVLITLSATDNPGGSGVAGIDYSVDKGGTIQHFATPFCVPTLNGYQIGARAVDNSGNFSSPRVVAYLGKFYSPMINR